MLSLNKHGFLKKIKQGRSKQGLRNGYAKHECTTVEDLDQHHNVLLKINAQSSLSQEHQPSPSKFDTSEEDGEPFTDEILDSNQNKMPPSLISYAEAKSVTSDIETPTPNQMKRKGLEDSDSSNSESEDKSEDNQASKTSLLVPVDPSYYQYVAGNNYSLERH